MGSKPKCKIVQGLPAGIAHRVGVDSCPHCGKGFNYDLGPWEKSATHVVLDIVHGKHGSIAVVSECPECFEKSWLHFTSSSFGDFANEFTEEIRLAARKELDRRHLGAVVTFVNSLCAGCKHLRKLECDTLPIVRCTYGQERKDDYLHSSFTETNCPKFEARPK